jgi:plastocyanin
MRNQLIGSICLGGLSVIGLLLWDSPARAADDTKTIDIVLGPRGPVFAEENVTISGGQSVEWVPKTPPSTPHHLVQKMPDGTDGPEITPVFHNPDTQTHKFGTPGVVKIQCTFHRGTMNQTITVK